MKIVSYRRHKSLRDKGILAVTSGGVGLLAGAYPTLAVLTAASMGLILWSFAAPTAMLYAIVGLRTFTDQASHYYSPGLPYGASDVLGMMVIPLAATLALSNPAAKRRYIGGVLLLVTSLGVAGFRAVDLYGSTEVVVSEGLRLVSLSAFALSALHVRTKALSVDIKLIGGVVVLAAVALMLSEPTTVGRVAGRGQGPFAHPNIASMAMALGPALGTWTWVRGGGRYNRAFSVAVVCAASIGLFLTRSVGGFAQASVSVGVFLIAAATQRHGARKSIAFAALFALLVAILGVAAFGSRIQELQGTLGLDSVSQGITTNSLDWRFFSWLEATKLFLQHPIVGHGLATTLYAAQPAGNITHSDVLRIALEFGLLGVAAMALLAQAITTRVMRIGDPLNRALALALLTGLAVRALAANVSQYTAPLVLAVVIIGRIIYHDARRERTEVEVLIGPSS